MNNCYLAVDIGASSGRHIIGYLEDGRLKLKEVYRFENSMELDLGKRLWNVDRLFKEIKNGMAACKKAGFIPASMSIDTWAVDYVLLDGEGRAAGETFGYRDNRTSRMDEVVYETIPEPELYKRTGIQKQIFNTIYQLTADREKRPEVLKQAKTFLMLPDYFQYRLTGVMKSEYTNASSTQLVNPDTRQWDKELIELLRLPSDIFLPLEMPGTFVGELLPEVVNEVGFNTKVRLCASHDTASAVMAMPKNDGSIYISSGTWSLMGVELQDALRDENSHSGNFTNEGGYDYRFRYLKNIMGLWMIQSVRHETKDAYSFAQLCEMAEDERDFPSRVDVNDSSFFAPLNMSEAIREYCKKTDQQVPETIGQLSTVVYQSLAESYGQTVKEIERNTGKAYDNICIIGGGANADYLNALTAKATGKAVTAGPTEATAIGNMVAQLIAGKEIKDLKSAREIIASSFDIKNY
ncbi:MAG TPA: rhamnulokinase [Lachnospiraceae bacterium]|nr:rhamnulokinase [Lachnospiraceae bacterium]